MWVGVVVVGADGRKGGGGKGVCGSAASATIVRAAARTSYE